MYYYIFKRFLDIIASVLLLIIAFPLMLIICFFLWLTNHRPVFFTQLRIGLNEKSFRLIKFRTMTDERDENGNLLPDEKRMTRFGSWLRKTSMDELPQLLDVLTGKMSLIGPRPLVEEYLALYDQKQRKRHNIRPGITGWAQVNGRNELSWQQKFEYDVWYVEHLNLLLDVKILALTIKKILKADGISMQGHATVKPFTGNNK